jgi:hypothetical protein
MLIGISGTVEGHDGGVLPGDVLDGVDDPTAARYIKLGYAEPAAEPSSLLPRRLIGRMATALEIRAPQMMRLPWS